MTDAATANGATILPVDSEHNAIFQCLAGSRRDDVSRIVLTASGGPFRTAAASDLEAMTPAQAVAHPNWSMSIGIGFNWVSPFGPIRLDLAKALLKQDGDDTKLFSFNVGTAF